MRLKPAKAGRLALLVGATAAVAGASLLGATAAKAAIGGPVGITLTPSSGSVTMLGAAVTYNAPACPAGFQGSGIIRAVNSDGTTYSVSAFNNSVAAAFSGTLLSNITLAEMRDGGDIGAGGTQEFVLQCYAGISGAGAEQNSVDVFVNWSADGTSWSTGTVTVATTTVTLTASPNPASTGATVTLTAKVTASDGSTPAGSVTFSVGGSAIGSPVTLDATGTATTTTSFSSSGTVQLTAAFTSSDTTKWQSSASSPVAENVTGPLSEPLQVTVGATGNFVVTIPTNNTVVFQPAADNLSATATANTVNIVDTRNTFPGWSVSGQATAFTETTGTGSIPAADLGWTPTGTLTDATLGPVVAPGSPGLGTPAIWASAAAGHGTTPATGDNVSANLLLNIPAATPAGTYNSALSVSYTTSAP